MAALAEGVPILYNSVVKNIRYSAEGVAVRTANKHEFTGVPFELIHEPLAAPG